MNKVTRNSEDFIAFLHWLKDEGMFGVESLIEVVEKPWKWQSEYEDFQEYIKQEDK